MVKKQARADDDDDVGGAVAVVSDLPVGIISDILSRLPVDDVARCKAVGKSWYELSNDILSQLTTTNSVLLWKAEDLVCPWISFTMISNNKNGEWKSITLSPQANVRGIVQASCNGLLCLNFRRHFHDLEPNLVYNPLTKQAIPLPQLNLLPDYRAGGYGYRSAFGFDPINNKYKLVSAYKRYCYHDLTTRMTAAILTLGETSWRPLHFPHDLQAVNYNEEPLFFNGAFHWFIGKHLYVEDATLFDGMLTLDITTENFQIINFLPSVRVPYTYLEPMQLDNSLAFAFLKNNNHLLGPLSFEIWQIQGANTDGTCLHKHRTFNVQIEGCPLVDMQGFRLLGAFHNGVFLFKAHQTSKRGEPLRNHLVIYDTRKDQGSVIEISGVPTTFNARIFSPSFISPTL